MPEVWPCVFSYGATGNSDFPLLLFFGREYNGTGHVIPTTGPYNSEKLRGSNLWTHAYTLISLACLEQEHLKERCTRARMSPLLFSNISPLPLPNSTSAKDRIRAGIPSASLQEHLLMPHQ